MSKQKKNNNLVSSYKKLSLVKKQKAKEKEAELKRQKVEYELQKKKEKQIIDQQLESERKALADKIIQKKNIEEKLAKQKCKSKAKALGLQSVYVIDGKYVVTAFGKGNNNEIVRIEDDNKNVIIEKEQPIASEIKVKSIAISKINNQKKLSTSVNKPAINKDVGMDYLGLKRDIEKWIFGREYPNSSLPIQIAYSILDIKKILAPFVNDIVFAVGNLDRQNNGEDLIGMLNYEFNRNQQKQNAYNPNFKNAENIKKRLNYFEQFDKNARKYYDYFGGVFIKPRDEKKDKSGKKTVAPKITEEQALDNNFNVLRILSMIRQFVFHCDIKSQNGQSSEAKSDYLYKLGKGMPEDLQEIIENAYSKDVSHINNQFFKTQGVNLTILSRMYNNQDLVSITKELYDFVIKKDNLNIGLRVATIRECIIKKYMPYLEHKKYDSKRSKIYSIMDFVLYKNLLTENGLTDEIVAQLRLCTSDYDKQNVYEKYSNALYDKSREKLSKILSGIDQAIDEKTSQKIEEKLKKKLPEDMFINSSNNLFVKLINYLCKFLDKKEINEIVTQLINKFEGIGNMLALYNQEVINEKIEFVDNYTMFDGSAKMAEDLKIVKSIARIKGENFGSVYEDAMDVLGIERNFVKEEQFAKKTDKQNRNSTSIRNFVINNVLKSKGFLYITRYTNPANCCEYAKNLDLLKYVLLQMPESQIDRYYLLFELKENVDIATKIERLAKNIKNYFGGKNFKDELLGVMGENKQKAQAIVGLYLSIMYIFVKNMVKINSVYTMAYFAMERDATLYGISLKNNDIYELKLLDEFIENNKLSEKNIDKINSAKDIYLKPKYKADFIDISRRARNKIDHLNIMASMHNYVTDAKVKGYYELYHYFLQELIFEEKKDSENNKILEKYILSINEYKLYSKDFTKLIFLPLAYNQSRYKNLVIGTLFNRFYGWNAEKDDKNKEKSSLDKYIKQ